MGKEKLWKKLLFIQMELVQAILVHGGWGSILIYKETKKEISGGESSGRGIR